MFYSLVGQFYSNCVVDVLVIRAREGYMHEHNINSILLPKPNSTGIPNSKLKVKYSDNKSPLNGDYVRTYRAEVIILLLAPSSGEL